MKETGDPPTKSEFLTLVQLKVLFSLQFKLYFYVSFPDKKGTQKDKVKNDHETPCRNATNIM